MLAKSSSNFLFGIYLEPYNFVNTAISIVRILKMELEDSHASLAKSLIGQGTVTLWLVFLTSDIFQFFLSF